MGLHSMHAAVRRRWLAWPAGALAAACLALQPVAATAQVAEYLGDSVHHPVYGTNGMVVSQNGIASAVGAQVLRDGGNAIDAAVATALALAVVLPRAGNIGGGGFMLAYLAEERRALVIDYRSVAPAAARNEMFVDAEGEQTRAGSDGYRAPAVPGTVAGLHMAHSRYGTLPWQQVVAPAIALARDGFTLSFEHVRIFDQGRERLENSKAAAAAFRRPDGSPYRPGDTLRQPDLARTLSAIAERGADGFYTGPVAALFASDMQRNGGLITAADLAGYRAIERPALAGTYRGHTVFSAPPASSGGTALIGMLNLLEQFDVARLSAGSAAQIHLLSEVMKHGHLDRRTFLGDTDFVRAPVRGLISKEYARERAKAISLRRSVRPSDYGPGDPWKFEGLDTTHLSVADASGNAVSNTYTIGTDFGSGVMIEGAGFLLNNQMSNFSSKATATAIREGRPLPPNSLAPGKRMLSSMTPTIVMKDDRPWLIVGTPGGSTIINTVLQVIVNVVDHAMNVAEAGQRPRIYQGGTSELALESGISEDSAAILKRMGHRVTRSTAVIGSSQSILIEGKLFSGAADTRRPDAAALAP